jgi:hypothetical protein
MELIDVSPGYKTSFTRNCLFVQKGKKERERERERVLVSPNQRNGDDSILMFFGQLSSKTVKTDKS